MVIRAGGQRAELVFGLEFEGLALWLQRVPQLPGFGVFICDWNAAYAVSPFRLQGVKGGHAATTGRAHCK